MSWNFWFRGPTEMFSVFNYFWSSLRSFGCSAFYRTWQTLSSFFIQKSPLPDIERNATALEKHSSWGDSPHISEFSFSIRYHIGLDTIGYGAAGDVYNVDDDIVLKALRVYYPLPDDADPRALQEWASENLYNHGVIKDEKNVLRLLAEHPHPNIMEAIDMDYPEGIYLRKYQPISDQIPPCQSDRIHWYRDIIRALLHLHKLGIAHFDLRTDNLLCDQKRHALLCDFSASCPFGYPNITGRFNGSSKTVCAATDQFSMGSLMYEMETGHRPKASLDDDGGLVLPQIHTGHNGLDSLIENAWRGKYASTADMLEAAECLDAAQDNRGPFEPLISKAELTARITQWRKDREEQYGYMLYGLPTEAELQTMAERHGIDPAEERRFP